MERSARCIQIQLKTVAYSLMHTARWRNSFIRRRKLCLFCSILTALVVIVLLWHWCPYHTAVPSSHWSQNKRDPRFVSVFPDTGRTFQEKHKKRILLWTPFFTGLIWDADHNVFQDCPVVSCEVTTNRYLLPQSDAVLFNVRDMSDHLSDPLPQMRRSEQVWILHNTEPPHYIYLPLHKYAGVFNWTSWYRRDATIYSPYGQWRLLTQDERANVQEEKHFHEKDKMVLWVSSNCNDLSHRMRLVEQLSKHINIDIYGKCGKLKCKQKCREVFDNYKFYLSFENGYCRDYMTEKFWRPVIRNQIPVVRGGADYMALAPAGSFINVDDFPDIPTLGEYLQKVASNESLYNSYFKWKQHSRLVPNGWTRINWCGVCERLHDINQPHQVYSDIQGWVQQDTCSLPCDALSG